MGSEYCPGRTTPETWVGTGGGRMWQMRRTAGKNDLSTGGDGQTNVKAHRDDESETDTEPLPDTEDEYTENHYSESEFHAEQEEDEEGEEQERQPDENERSRVEVSRHPPTDFDAESHLLHIDFVTDQLEQFGTGASPGNRRVAAIASGMATKKLPGQQHNISFSRDRVREIERTNQILLRRILSTRPTLHTQAAKLGPTKSYSSANSSRVTSAALNRKKIQRKISDENEILLKKVTCVGLSKRATC